MEILSTHLRDFTDIAKKFFSDDIFYLDFLNKSSIKNSCAFLSKVVTAGDFNLVFIQKSNKMARIGFKDIFSCRKTCSNTM